MRHANILSKGVWVYYCIFSPPDASARGRENFMRTLCEIGNELSHKDVALGHSVTRIKLQIDSAGGHSTTRGHSNLDDLAAMMDTEFIIELFQQPGNSPMFSILYLAIWRTTRVLVDKISMVARPWDPDIVRRFRRRGPSNRA